MGLAAVGKTGRREGCPLNERDLKIRTPEGVSFSLLLAGPTARMLAWAVDFACISVGASVLQGVLRAAEVLSPDVAVALTAVAIFIFQIGYGIVLEWRWRGQTVGKRLLRLRVVDREGLRLTWSQVVVRNLLRAVDSLPLLYAVGGLSCVITRHAQRLGDLAANTVVVREDKVPPPIADELIQVRYNSLRDYPHLTARLRQRCSAAEADVALQAVLRRESLEPEARLALFQSLSEHFRAKVIFPPEALDGLSDEAYVRDIVQLLFDERSSRKLT